MTYYEKNIKALKENHEYVADILEDYSGPKMSKEKVKKLNSEGSLDIEYKKYDQIIVIGFTSSLRKLKNECSRVIIIEPHISYFDQMLRKYDFTDLFTKPANKLIFLFSEHVDIFQGVNKYLKIQLESKLIFIHNENLEKIYPEIYTELNQKVDNAIHYKNINLVTNIKHSREWRNNQIGNLAYIFSHPKADNMFNKFKGVPCISVANGPSLDDNIHKLKKVKGKALIFACGSATKTLISHGIQPDAAFSIDGHKNNWKIHFEDIVKEDLLQKTYLFTELGNYFRINWNWPYRQVFFTMKRNFSGWIEEINGDYTVIKTGGTVAHSTVDMAAKLGCNPVILMGQDLSYPGGRYHAKGSGYDGTERDNDKGKIEIEGIKGPVMTTAKYKTMIEFFEGIFNSHKGTQFIDATEGGCKFKGTEVDTLENVLKNCKPVNAREKLDKLYDKHKPDFSKKQHKVEHHLNFSINQLSQAITLSESQLLIVDNILKEITKGNIPDIEPVKAFEPPLKQLEKTRYFVERTLIQEELLYQKSQEMEYENTNERIKTQMEAYRNYRQSYVNELKQCKKMILGEYGAKEGAQ